MKRKCLGVPRSILELTFFFFTIYGKIHSYIGRGRQWTIDQMIEHFKCPCVIKEPKGCKVWSKERVTIPDQIELQRMQADYWFVWQRLNGVTRNLIRRTHGVPDQQIIVFFSFLHVLELLQKIILIYLYMYNSLCETLT